MLTLVCSRLCTAPIRPTFAGVSVLYPVALVLSMLRHAGRTPAHLAQAISDAKENKYALGVKLVRGAYHPHEAGAHAARSARKPSLSISPDVDAPVWSTKADTDRCFDECAAMLVTAIGDDIAASNPPSQRSYKGARSKVTEKKLPTIGVLFGTHNWASCNKILDSVVQSGFAYKEPGEDGVIRMGDDITERLTFGQLYGQSSINLILEYRGLFEGFRHRLCFTGMSDDLTAYIVRKTKSSTPFVIK